MDARQNLGLVVSKSPTGSTPGTMDAGQYPGLVVCKPPTGPTPGRMDAGQYPGLLVSKPPTGPTPGTMDAGQYPGLLVCKPPTGRTPRKTDAGQSLGPVVSKPPAGPTPGRFRRTKVGKYSQSHIPNKELFNRMVGKKRPTPKTNPKSKSVSDPARKKTLGLINSLADVEEPKQVQQQPKQEQQQPKQQQQQPQQQQQDASVRPNWHGINNPARPTVHQGYNGSREVGLAPFQGGQSSMDADMDDLLQFAASFGEGAEGA